MTTTSAGRRLADPLEILAFAADRLAVPLRREQLALLARYTDLIGKWNKVYNLTAARSTTDVLLRHVIDCLSCVAPLRRRAPDTRSILDVGSGAGLPGLVLAVAMPELHVSCVDAVAKKAAFIRQAAAELGMVNVTAIHSRVEALRTPTYPLITSRAMASLADLLSQTQHLLQMGGQWMAMKSSADASELERLEAAEMTFHVEPLAPAEGLERRSLIWIQRKSDCTLA